MKLKGKWRDIVIPEKQVFGNCKVQKETKWQVLSVRSVVFYCSDRLISPKKYKFGKSFPEKCVFREIFRKRRKV